MPQVEHMSGDSSREMNHLKERTEVAYESNFGFEESLNTPVWELVFSMFYDTKYNYFEFLILVRTSITNVFRTMFRRQFSFTDG